MPTSSQSSDTPRAQSIGFEGSKKEQANGLAEVSALAESLDPKDRMRLIAHLLETLPRQHRTAIVDFVLQDVVPASNEVGVRIDASPVDARPTLWDRLFGPVKTSELYSAPRRFDLATIFVVTAAYSILFGAMSALNEYFGPGTKVAVGVLVTVVAVAQAFYKDVANPRGVSVVTGAVVQTIIMLLMVIFAPQLLPFPGLIVVILFGVLGGAFSGYLAGVLVGGVFLVADALRKRYVRDSDQLHEAQSTDHSELVERGESPWAN